MHAIKTFRTCSRRCCVERAVMKFPQNTDFEVEFIFLKSQEFSFAGASKTHVLLFTKVTNENTESISKTLYKMYLQYSIA